MKVIYGIGRDRKIFNNGVLAIGVFDGLHIGHQKLIKAAVKKAQLRGGPAMVMTFYPHPVEVLHPQDCMPYVVSLPHRLELMKRLGVAACIVVRFTKRFSQLSADQFIKRYLVESIRPREVFVGHDFRFGNQRSGTIEYFKKAGRQYGFHVHCISSVKWGREKIGSSRIRRLVAAGKLDAAQCLLGRYVAVMGKVQKGDRRGKNLGFPTANIYPQNTVIPPIGVYAVRVIVNEYRYDGMANIGRRPSFHSQDNNINIEVHIFNFHKILYNKNIIIEFVKKIRNERVFASTEELIAQLKRDHIKSILILNNLRK